VRLRAGEAEAVMAVLAVTIYVMSFVAFFGALFAILSDHEGCGGHR
jgi:hypothetical protein